MQQGNMLSSGFEIQLNELTAGSSQISMEVEILHLLKGSAALAMEQETFPLQKNAVFIVNPGESYTITEAEDCLACRLSIQPRVFSDMLGTQNFWFKYDSVSDPGEHHEELVHKLNELLYGYLSNGSAIGFAQIGLLYQILDIVSGHYLVPVAEPTGAGASQRQEQRIQDVIRFVQQNYMTPITLNELASSMYVSDSHLSRVIKKELGISFRDYLNQIRLKHAISDLMNTDKTIIRIANDNGFSGTAMFNKTFRDHFGMTPSTYKRKQGEQSVSASIHHNQLAISAIRLVESNLAEQQKASKQPENPDTLHIKADVSVCRDYSRPWQKMINGCTAAGMLNFKMQEHLLQLKKGLGFSYVRFWGIFDENMMLIPKNADGEMNFSRIDDLIGFLLKNDIKPFMVIGPKPFIITKNPGERLEASNPLNETLLSYDSDQWERILNRLFAHLWETYGGQEMDTWIFEAWSPGPWDTPWYRWYSEEKYVRMYKIIKQYAPGALVGGGEFTISAHLWRFEEIISYWRNRGAEPDFISWSAFPYMVDNAGAKHAKLRWLSNSDYMENLVLTARTAMAENGLRDKMLIISAWNLTISNRSVLNDSVFKGAYIVNNAFYAIDNFEMLGYWLSSDSFAEDYDSTEILFGGAGLMNKDGILKPAYYAFAFLRGLRSLLVQRHSNYVITCNQRGNYTIVYHNQSNLNYNVYLKDEGDLSYQEMGQAMNGSKSRTFVFLLQNVRNQAYNIRHQLVNADSGSIQDEWQRLGAFKVMPNEDRDYLKQVVVPKRNFSQKRVTSGELELTVSAAPNEFGILEIFPITL